MKKMALLLAGLILGTSAMAQTVVVNDNHPRAVTQLEHRRLHNERMHLRHERERIRREHMRMRHHYRHHHYDRDHVVVVK